LDAKSFAVIAGIAAVVERQEVIGGAKMDAI
jgi:hypothetical protein